MPVSEVMGQSTDTLICQKFVLLPLLSKTLITNDIASQEQLETSVIRSNHSPEEPDFNGDGCADLAVGVSGEVLGSGERHGQVSVIYGSTTGLTGDFNQVWHRDGGYAADGSYLGNLQTAINNIDEFGASLATSDFNNDGYTDLGDLHGST